MPAIRFLVLVLSKGRVVMQNIPLSTRALVRLATAAVNEQIAAIWNYKVQWSTATFDTELRTLEQQDTWLAAHSDAYPALVIVAGREVLAYGALAPYRARQPTAQPSKMPST